MKFTTRGCNIECKCFRGSLYWIRRSSLRCLIQIAEVCTKPPRGAIITESYLCNRRYGRYLRVHFASSFRKYVYSVVFSKLVSLRFTRLTTRSRSRPPSRVAQKLYEFP